MEWLMMYGIQVPDEAGFSTDLDSICHHRCTIVSSLHLTFIPWVDSEMSRFSSQLEMSCASKVLSGKASISKIFQEQDAWLYTVEV